MRLPFLSVTTLVLSITAPALAQDANERAKLDRAHQAKAAAARANKNNPRRSVTLVPSETDTGARLGWRAPEPEPETKQATAPKTFTPAAMPGVRVKWPAVQPRSASATTLNCAPEFSAREGRQARIRVRLSAESVVEQKGDDATIRFLLPGSKIPARTTTRPLVTTFFDTPLQGVQLVPSAAGGELILWLREPANVTHRVADRGNGVFELIVELAPPAVSASLAPSLSPTLGAPEVWPDAAPSATPFAAREDAEDIFDTPLIQPEQAAETAPGQTE